MYTPRPTVQYDMPLIAVERPTDVSARWGDHEIRPADSTGFVYEDELVRMTVAKGKGTFHLLLENLSEHTIQLIWNEAVFVGPTGTSSRVSSGETRVMDMNRSQPNAVIPRGANAMLIAVPNDHHYTGTYSSGTIDFVPTPEIAPRLEGSELRLVLPLQVQGVVNEYSLLFRIEDVRVVDPSGGAGDTPDW